MSIGESKPVLFFATVKDTKDPLKIGRVQVELKSLDKPVEMPWLRVLQSQASKTHGLLILPEKGETVAVLRGNEESVHGMVVLGSVYDKKNPPPIQDSKGKNDIKCFKTRTGHTVSFSDEKGKSKINICSGKGIGIAIDDKAFTLKLFSKAVSVLLDGKGKNFKVVAPKKVHIKGKEIILDAKKILLKGKKITIKGKKVAIKGKKVNIKGKKLAIKGTKIKIKAGMKCVIKAGVKVKVKGAITSVG